MISAVFDCMVYLQAAVNDQSPAYACLELAESSQVRLFVSPAVLVELQDVLSRPALQKKFPQLTPSRVRLFLRKLLAVAIAGKADDCGVQLRDPDDLPYLNLAISENAEYLVTRDKDLLDLMSDPNFRDRFALLKVVDPVGFLNEVRSKLRSS